MRVIFNDYGRLVKATGSSIFKQSNNANKLQLVLPFANGENVASVSATFLLPYGKNSGQFGQYSPNSLILTKEVDIGNGGYIWAGLIGAGYLINYGKAYFSARVTYVDGVVKTTELVQFIIENSADYMATSVPPETAEQLETQITANRTDILKLQTEKQDKIVPQGTFTNGETAVVDAINKNSYDITDNRNDITQLKTIIANGENYIGTVDVSSLDNIDTLLNEFVSNTIGREPQNNDVVIVNEVKQGEVDKHYKFIYGAVGWTSYEIPPQQVASNKNYGVIKGTFNTNKDLKVDIDNGEISDILAKQNNGVYLSIDKYLNANSANIDTNTVAIEYLKDNTYSKTESDDKFLEKTYGEVYYYASPSFAEDVPIKLEPQFSKEVSTVGKHSIFNLLLALKNKTTFNKSSSDNSIIWVSANRETDVSFVLTTNAYTTTEEYTLSINTTGVLHLSPDSPVPLNYNVFYSALQSPVTLDVGDRIKKSFEVVTYDSIPLKIDVYSNQTYPSTLNLVVDNLSYTINKVGKPLSIKLPKVRFTTLNPDTQLYEAVIPQSEHLQPPSDDYMIWTRFVDKGASERIIVQDKISANGDITISVSEKQDLVVYIASERQVQANGVLELTNPQTLSVDYDKNGVVKILATEVLPVLLLNRPNIINQLYYVIVYNQKESTENVLLKTRERTYTITPGLALSYRWVGEWIIAGAPSSTEQILDPDKQQLLNTTLSELESNKANKNLDNVTENVLLDTLGNLGLVKAEQINTDAGIDLSTKANKSFVVKYTFSSSVTSIIQSVSLPANNIVDIFIDYTDDQYHYVELKPATGVKINGSLSSITLNKKGYNGRLISVINDFKSEWVFIPDSNAESDIKEYNFEYGMRPSGLIQSDIIENIDGGQFTADSNGYFVANFNLYSSDGDYIEVKINNGISLKYGLIPGTWTTTGLIPLKRGQTVQLRPHVVGFDGSLANFETSFMASGLTEI